MGVGRKSNSTDTIDLDWGTYWVSYANLGGSAVCVGDSGGPAINNGRIGLDLAVGIWSAGMVLPNCVSFGGEMIATKTTDKVPWIVSTLASLGETCTQFIGSGTVYRRCF